MNGLGIVSLLRESWHLLDSIPMDDCPQHSSKGGGHASQLV